jgi:lipopolysaccharide export system permease protein
MLTFAENSIDLTQNGRNAEQRFRDYTEMSMDELWHPDPAVVSPRDVPKLRVEAHRRLSGPANAASFTLVALVAVLTGGFRRHGGLLRPVLAVLTIVVLLAAGLAIANLAARLPQLIPLIWVEAIAPGVASAWILFGSGRFVPRRRALAARAA